MLKFTGDGYRDREALAEYLRQKGYLWATDPRRNETIIAAVCAAIDDNAGTPGELAMVARGIVYCAREDELID